MPTMIEELEAYLRRHHPVQQGLWSYSTNNRLPPDWLLATPTGVFGTLYRNFKMAVKGDYPDFDLARCTTSDGPTQSCVALGATVRAPGEEPVKLLVGHSEAMVEAVYDVMVSAEKFLDLVMLTPPTGRYLAAMRNAMSVLGRRPETGRPIVRVFYSNPWPLDVFNQAATFLTELMRGVTSATPMSVYAGVISSSIDSWNHAKIIAADGARALVGGHNLWQPPYLDAYPVFDVSMKVEGQAALDAHDYADFLWRFAIKSLAGERSWFTFTGALNNVAAWSLDPDAHVYQVTRGVTPPGDLFTQVRPGLVPGDVGTIPVLSIGRQAAMDASAFLPTSQTYLDEYREPADLALRQMITLARSTIRVSQHALSFPFINRYIDTEVFFWWGTWNFELFLELGKALQRGVDVFITLSNPGALAGDRPFVEFGLYTGEAPSKVNAYMLDVLTRQLRMTDAAARTLMNQKFHAGSFRYSSEDTYPNGAAIPNHAKTLIVDDRLFYVGSQNLYKSNLNEFGYIVEDAAAGQRYADDYFTPLWRQAQRTVDPTFSDDLKKQLDAEAVGFVLELRHNRRLAKTWADTLAERADQTGDAELEQTAIILNDIVANAGFYTNSSSVLSALQSPFFTTDQSQHQANREALRFVRDLMTDRALLKAFTEVVGSNQGSDPQAAQAIDQFLAQRGYKCNTLQAAAALEELRPQTLAYWVGVYDGWVKPDGGTAYADFTPAEDDDGDGRRATRRAAAGGHEHDPDAIRTVEALSLTVLDNLRARLGNDQLEGLTFQDGVLSWDTGAGNRSSGSLTFSRIGQPGLNDHYTGLECYGTVTWPDDGTAPYRGKVSYYGRWNRTVNVDQPDHPTSFPWPVTVILALAGLIGLAALGFLLWRRKLAADQRDRDLILDHIDDYVPLASRNSTVYDQLTKDLRAGRLTANEFKKQVRDANAREQTFSNDAIELQVISRRRLVRLEGGTSGLSVDRDALYREIKASLDDMIEIQEDQLARTVELGAPGPELERLSEGLTELSGRVERVTTSTSAADVGTLFQDATRRTVDVNTYVEKIATARASGNETWLERARILDGQRIDLASQANVARAKLDVADRYEPPEGTDLPETRIDLPEEI